ncbi:N-acetylglucosaminyl transferase component-domain-containing protein [Schizophyllum commune]
MSLSIFWPDDVRHSGTVLGWSSPAVWCIAGVLSKEENTPKLDDILLTLRPDPPRVLGSCSFAKGSWVPELQLDSSKPYNIILYRRHKPVTLRYHCLTPPGALPPSHSAPGPAQIRKASAGIDELIIEKFNRAWTVDDAVQRALMPRRTRGTREPLIWALASTIARSLAPYILLASQIARWICSAPLLLWKASDILLIAQQIDVRSEQAQFFVREAGSLAGEGGVAVPVLAGRYTNFFNIVWLIVNDITVGIAVGSFLCENHAILAKMLDRVVQDFLVTRLIWVLHWLDSWPAGLKLNTELSRFYAHSFSEIISAWGGLLGRASAFLPVIIYATGVASFLGVSFSISIVSDVLALATVHTYVCYTVSNAIYSRMLKTAGSLWNLFRGKRFNVLRNRTDSWEYDIDQLLFGTVLFTLLAFLFPTVLAYHAVFAAVRLGIISLYAGLETLLAFINHFPLFALMLRIKDPWRLPGKVLLGFHVVNHLLLLRPNPDFAMLQNLPVPLSSIFFQYVGLSKRLAAHYNPVRLLRHVLTGRFLDAIPRYSIRYDKINEPRATEE